MNKLLFLSFLVLTIFTPIAAQEVIEIYQGKAPGSENWTQKEGESLKNLFNTRVVYNVTKPTLTAYLPPRELATGTAVVICPGGGFQVLSMDSEGVDVAKWLNSKGIAAFVLKYRLVESKTDDPVGEIMSMIQDRAKLKAARKPVIPLAVADGKKAIEYVRTHAKAYDILPNQIGLMGFSAGGRLAMGVAFDYSSANRPDFIAPIYASTDDLPTTEVPADAPPAFIVVAADDQLGLTDHSLKIYQQWQAAQKSAELHIYEKGGHGFGMREQKLPSDTWIDRFADWAKAQGFRKKLYPNKYEKLYGEEAVAAFAKQEAFRVTQDFGFLEKFKTANQKVAPPKSKENRVVFLGNSIVEGWVNTDSTFFINNNYIGRGISGQTSPQLLLRFRQDVVNLQPKVVVLNIGTNDIAENTGPYDLDFTMGNIISMTEIAKTNGITPILASVLPAAGFPWKRALGDPSEKIIQLNERIKAYAKAQKLVYLDYHQAMKNEQNGLSVDIAADGVHPTLKGYKIMEQLAKVAIAKALD